MSEETVRQFQKRIDEIGSSENSGVFYSIFKNIRDYKNAKAESKLSGILSGISAAAMSYFLQADPFKYVLFNRGFKEYVYKDLYGNIVTKHYYVGDSVVGLSLFLLLVGAVPLSISLWITIKGYRRAKKLRKILESDKRIGRDDFEKKIDYLDRLFDEAVSKI
jgi:hypothetical protein